MSFQVSVYKGGNLETSFNNGNSTGNNSETVSLKALCNRVLHGNRQGNKVETGSFHAGKQEGCVFPSLEERFACLIYSEILQASLWVVYGCNDAETLRAQGYTEAIYTAEEILKLKGAERETLTALQHIKEVFPASAVEEHSEGGL